MADVALGGSAELADSGLRYEVDGEIATITLNRPEKRNAQTFATWLGLARIGHNLPEQVRVVVVNGEGPSFSAGIDLRMFTADGIPGQRPIAEVAAMSRRSFSEWLAPAQEGFLWLRRPGIVSVAAVQGHAVGAGFQLALACDLRVLAADARFSMREASHGLVPDLTGTKPLVDLVGLPRAIELCLTGRSVGADEALRLGLAELVVEPADLESAVADLTAALLAVDRDVATATKRLLTAARTNTLEEQAAAERHEQWDRIQALFARG
ncbi:Enoyl-CoA hydratase/carnithine racemase [Sinosporangium album]|uniref:Enoyl-CoA hydratase/carnithine racemase n=1 Tax=Sinosporangium album TaxID=504805 RepID=A0A1G8G1A2_9ACTN|nr:enoyl-CoA hydratase/isomerase family protein [Sinosporangium album]SDH88163.1 Enoyl-CoA hydratase/carnithine racemase [Sinosporangium album]